MPNTTTNHAITYTNFLLSTSSYRVVYITLPSQKPHFFLQFAFIHSFEQLSVENRLHSGSSLQTAEMKRRAETRTSLTRTAVKSRSHFFRRYSINAIGSFAKCASCRCSEIKSFCVGLFCRQKER